MGFESVGDDMLIEGNKYLRLTAVPIRKGLFAKGEYTYEVLTHPGEARVVDANHLADAIGVGPHGPWNDLQECQRTASRLFKEGRRKDWVEYGTAIIVPEE
jgi:hypothetical protein